MLVVDGCWLMGGSVFSTLECTTRSMDSSLECAVWILSIATVCILGVVYSRTPTLEYAGLGLGFTTLEYES